ncbi:MAG: hypothetical protein JXC32_00680, partial [Anaerolineae bacterium]|nr:hypothetical protein [Anaerolineae bacterium]
EPENVTPDQYDWTAADTDILNAVRSGHKLIVTIVSNPSWAATIQQGPIDKVPLSEYVQFVQALIERYDGDGNMDAPGSPVVRHWEFYNEPDSVNSLAAEEGHGGFWGDYGAEYAAMLCAVYPAAKAAHPATHVVFGGIAYDLFVDQGGSFNRQFLDDVLGAGGGNCFDVMNFHYYPLFAATWDPYGYGLIGKTAYLRNKLTNYGAGGKPFVVTEAGWHSDYYSDAAPGSDQIQSQYVVKLFTQASAAGLDSLAWWTWMDPSGGWWGANGLLTTEREPKVSFGVYQYAAQTIGQAGFLRVYPTPAGVEGYEFMSARQTRLYVFWARDGQPHALDLPASLVTVTSMYGDLIGQVSDGADGRTDGWVRFTVAEDPIYVEVLH